MTRRHSLQKPSRADTVIQYGTIAAKLLRDIGDATNLPYLKAIAGTVRTNKEQCFLMTERSYELICAIINVCRDTEVKLAPAMIRSIDQFTETLRKMVTFMQRQVRGSVWRRVFRHAEDQSILEECQNGLKHALDVFGVQSGIIAVVTMAEMQKDASQRHDELLATLAARALAEKEQRKRTSGAQSISSRRSAASRSSTMSSMSSQSSTPSLSWSSDSGMDETLPPGTPTSMRSQISLPKLYRSGSPPPSPASTYSFSSRRRRRIPSVDLDPSTFCVLPARPKIFRGRDKELESLTNSLLQHRRCTSRPSSSCSASTSSSSQTNPCARIAILGPEGIGKSSLVLYAVHHPDIEKEFGVNRYFIGCPRNSVPCSLDDFLLTISNYFDLDPKRKLSKSIVRHLSSMASPTLLVLDNLEEIWDQMDQRADLEDILSVLADIEHLTIVITMRGTKRPRQILWTRPFLTPLPPLSPSAARETFLDISDVSPEDPDLEELLSLSDHNPQKLTLMAGLASFEGCTSLLDRWQREGELLLKESIDSMKPVDSPKPPTDSPKLSTDFPKPPIDSIKPQALPPTQNQKLTEEPIQVSINTEYDGLQNHTLCQIPIC
ncbi:hypothetical protein C8J56DRAFT_881077 [Mycena floridula]|nr:hypothetical protein C8J56DRAFT_881077 [Mycena floridula]